MNNSGSYWWLYFKADQIEEKEKVDQIPDSIRFPFEPRIPPPKGEEDSTYCLFQQVDFNRS